MPSDRFALALRSSKVLEADFWRSTVVKSCRNHSSVMQNIFVSLERSGDISEIGLTLNSGAPLRYFQGSTFGWCDSVDLSAKVKVGRLHPSRITERFLLKHTHPNCWVHTIVLLSRSFVLLKYLFIWEPTILTHRILQSSLTISDSFL